ncbi:MAG TPA: trypsin-like peptidase domain-containing protein, partial [Acidimicrobiales bacterium]|nr:trypsin-like peptidase domain-containing protein [Acidimicrobiales bacterium]
PEQEATPDPGPPPGERRRRPVDRRPRPDEHRPGGGRPSLLRRHFAPPSAFGVVVIALTIAVLTGVAGAYVWANNDAGRLRVSGPTSPSTVRPAELAPPPEIENTTTTRPDLSPEAVARTVGPAVWTVNTLNSAGQPVTGAAFLVGSPGGRGLLVTSLTVVEASTRQPGPEITVVGGGYNGAASLWTWDEARDLALLTVGRSAPAPRWADEPLRPGDRIYAVGGGGKVAAGIVTAVTGTAVQHNVFIEDPFRGGPLVNAKGDVVAVSSAAFTGGGKATDTAFFGVPVRDVCAGVLRCGDAAVPPTTTPGGGSSTTQPG